MSNALLLALALNTAVEQLGVKEDPPNSNRGFRIDGYSLDLGYHPGRPWCAIFVSWVLRKAAEKVPMPIKFRGSSQCLRMVELNKDLHLDRAEPLCIFVNLEPGASGKGHCGFVTGVEEDTGMLLTLEGNTDKEGSRTGGQVMRQRRKADYPECFIKIA